MHDFDGFDDELWDEFKWEAHLDEVEKKSEQLRRFITSSHSGNIPRWITLLEESLDEDDAFEAFVEEELLLDEAYFPEEEDDWEDEEDDEFDGDDFLFGSSDMDFDDYDEGEDWKSLSDDFAQTDQGSIDNLHIFSEAKDLAVDTLKWAETVSADLQTPAFQEFVGETLKIGAKLAGGYSFGFETEYIGGNIAYTKKALRIANRALDLLQSLKKQSYFNPKDYQQLHSRLFELRNDIGVYVQELRTQFNLGLE